MELAEEFKMTFENERTFEWMTLYIYTRDVPPPKMLINSYTLPKYNSHLLIYARLSSDTLKNIDDILTQYLRSSNCFYYKQLII